MSNRDTARTIVAFGEMLFALSVIVIAVLALRPHDRIVTVQHDRIVTVQSERVERALARERTEEARLEEQIRASQASEAKSLAAIRYSLDHVTVRVHLSDGCQSYSPALPCKSGAP